MRTTAEMESVATNTMASVTIIRFRNLQFCDIRGVPSPMLDRPPIGMPSVSDSDTISDSDVECVRDIPGRDDESIGMTYYLHFARIGNFFLS